MCRLACTVHLAQGDDRPYDELPACDFAGDFSLKNGINPAALLDRLVAQDARSIVDTSPHEDCTDVSILEIIGGFDRPGGVLSATVNAQGIPSSCTSDPADAQAMALANAFRALLFPKASGDPWRPAPSHRRQDNVFDTRNGSCSHNPLGLWRLTCGLTDAFPQALESHDTPGLAAHGTCRLGGFSRMTAYTLTGRGRSSSVFCGPRFQGWNITTQGGSQQ